MYLTALLVSNLVKKEELRIPGVKRKRQTDSSTEDSSTRRKWTAEDGKLIKKLKEEQHLTWALFPAQANRTNNSEIAEYFPGLLPSRICNSYNVRLKGLLDEFTKEEVSLSIAALTSR